MEDLTRERNMLEAYNEMIARQYEACFGMLGACIDKCEVGNANLR